MIMRAYVNIATRPGTAINVVRRLRENEEEILSADAVYGRFDAIAVVQAPVLEDLDQIVFDTIQSDPNVMRTETSIVLGVKELK